MFNWFKRREKVTLTEGEWDDIMYILYLIRSSELLSEADICKEEVLWLEQRIEDQLSF